MWFFTTALSRNNLRTVRLSVWAKQLSIRQSYFEGMFCRFIICYHFEDHVNKTRQSAFWALPLQLLMINAFKDQVVSRSVREMRRDKLWYPRRIPSSRSILKLQWKVRLLESKRWMGTDSFSDPRWPDIYPCEWSLNMAKIFVLTLIKVLVV